MADGDGRKERDTLNPDVPLVALKGMATRHSAAVYMRCSAVGMLGGVTGHGKSMVDVWAVAALLCIRACHTEHSNRARNATTSAAAAATTAIAARFCKAVGNRAGAKTADTTGCARERPSTATDSQRGCGRGSV